MPPRVLLVLPTTSYKAQGFLDAVELLGLESVVATDRRQALEALAPGTTLALDFRAGWPIERVASMHHERPFAAVLGVDDETAIVAARIAAGLGLAHDDVDAVRAARDKHETRRRLAAAGLPTPAWRRVELADDERVLSRTVDYPCVIKPLHLSAGRGVLRVDDPASFALAFRRVRALLGRRDVRQREGDADHLLIESYIPGREVAVEGLLIDGVLHVLALFDKPDPLVGPTFDETLLVTPSCLPARVQSGIEATVAAACRAIGLRRGPIHAECRVDGSRVVPLEIAPRTIGGLCARAVREAIGTSLESLVLQVALGRHPRLAALERRPAGALMLPVPVAGVLREVRGVEAAGAVRGVIEVAITVGVGSDVEPLPEGHAYVGFVFAAGDSPRAVERALREAWARLEIVIDQKPGESVT